MRTNSTASEVQLAWHVTPAAEGGERHVAEVFHEGRAVGVIRFWRPGEGTSPADAWPSRVWRNGHYERGFYEWFYEAWYVTLKQPPLLVEDVAFELSLDPTLDLEGRAVLAAIETLAAPRSAVVGRALELLPPDERARAKAAGLVAWAGRVAARVYAGALIVAAADDVVGPASLA